MKRNFNIIGYRKVWYALSGLLFVASISAVILWGLKLGIDFTGGSLIEVSFSRERPVVSEIASAVPEGLGSAHVTPLGDKSATLRTKNLSQDEYVQLIAALKEKFAGENETAQEIIEERFTSIGPTIGAELQRKALWSIGFVLGAIVLYIAWAFRKISKPIGSWQYGVIAIIALFHDVLIPTGIFAALGHFKNVEIDTLFITALLTVLGFSVHDTIVVFDRVRENLLKSSGDFATIVSTSVNETLMRSLNTSLATLIALFMVYFFGGHSIHYFVLTLILGITFGTYSSIFIASPLLVTWHLFLEKRRK